MRGWGEPGGGWILAFSVDGNVPTSQIWSLHTYLDSAVVAYWEYTSWKVSSSIIPTEVSLEKLPVTLAGIESYLQSPPLPGILPVPKAC